MLMSRIYKSITAPTLCCRLWRYTSSCPRKDIPGPAGWPVFGNAIEVTRSLHKLHLFYDSNLKKFGDLIKLRFPGGFQMVVTGNANAVERVLRAEGEYPQRAERLTDMLQWFYSKQDFPNGLFFSSGADWKQLRSAMTKQVVPRRLGQYVSDLNEVSQHMIEYMEREKDVDGVLHDIFQPFNRWAMEGMNRIMYGENLQLINEPSESAEKLEFLTAVRSYSECITELSVASPIHKYLPTKLSRKLTKTLTELYTIGNRILQNKFQTIKAALETGDEVGISFLEQWLIEEEMNENVILSQATDLLAGGSETTAITATFMLHELALNPEVQQMVYEEVASIVGTSKLATFEDLQKLTHVKNTIRETLRLYPVAPYIARTLNQDIELFGYNIPAKTMIIFSMYTAGRDQNYFKDPLKFKPWRWRAEKDTLQPFASLPFGFGPRACYGRRIAELELQLLLIQVVQKYILKTHQQSIPLVERTFLRPAVPVNLQVESRN